MPSTPAMMLTILSLLALTIMSVSGLEVTGNALIPRLEPCGNPSSNCEACGAGFLACGQNTCFNPSAGETCCDAASNWVCAPGTTCSHIRGQCLQPGEPDPHTTLTMSTTMTTTETATSTKAVVATSAPGESYGPAPPASAPVPPSSALAPPLPPVDVTTTVIPGPPNSTYVPTIETTAIPGNTTWTTSTELTIVANATAPSVTSTPSAAAPTLPLTSTSTTVLTPVSTATYSVASTSSAAATSAASAAYIEPGFWKAVGLLWMVLVALVCQA